MYLWRQDLFSLFIIMQWFPLTASRKATMIFSLYVNSYATAKKPFHIKDLFLLLTSFTSYCLTKSPRENNFWIFPCKFSCTSRETSSRNSSAVSAIASSRHTNWSGNYKIMQILFSQKGFSLILICTQWSLTLVFYINRQT